METGEPYRDSLDYLVSLIKEQPSQEDKQKLAALDKELIERVRGFGDYGEMQRFQRIIDYMSNAYVISKTFREMSKDGQREELFDIYLIRDLMNRISDLTLKRNAIEEPYLEAWRDRVDPDRKRKQLVEN